MFNHWIKKTGSKKFRNWDEIETLGNQIMTQHSDLWKLSIFLIHASTNSPCHLLHQFLHLPQPHLNVSKPVNQIQISSQHLWNNKIEMHLSSPRIWPSRRRSLKPQGLWIFRQALNQKHLHCTPFRHTLHIEPISSSPQHLSPFLVYHQTFKNKNLKNHTCKSN